MELQVGFIGIGMMGLPMVEHLAGHGALRVLAFDAAPQRLELLHGHPGWGKTLCAAVSLAELTACEVVVTMLPNSTITSAVIADLRRVLRAGAVIVDMGSSDPMQTRSLAQRLEETGIRLLDAPVSGSVAKARSGTLTIMVGGDEEAYGHARPVLEAMGSTLLRTGAAGSAHAMKALNNYVYAAGLMAVSEALTIARRMDLDLEAFADVLNASSGRNVATETKLRQFMMPRAFSGGFALRLQAKDLATARSLQQAMGLAAPQLELCEHLWQQAAQSLEPGADNTEILRFVEGRSP
jgi:3-hydroxyisobutyrate dehydrogenase